LDLLDLRERPLESSRRRLEDRADVADDPAGVLVVEVDVAEVECRRAGLEAPDDAAVGGGGVIFVPTSSWSVFWIVGSVRFGSL